MSCLGSSNEPALREGRAASEAHERWTAGVLNDVYCGRSIGGFFN